MRKSTKQKLRIRQSKMRELKIQKSRIRESNYENRMKNLHNLLCAIKSQDKDYIDNITTDSVNVNGDYRSYFGTPLHMAATVGNYEIFITLIKKGADIHKRQSRTQRTILHSAMQSSNYDIVRYLIDNGVDVNATLENCIFITGETALHIAAAKGTKEIIKLLLDNNAKVNTKNERGITPIIRAVKANNHDAMDILMEYGADLFCTFKKNKYNETIFHSAVTRSNWKLLFDWLFLFADTCDDNNISFFSFFKSQLLIHYVLSMLRDKHEIIMFLLELGLDINALDSNGKLAIELEFQSKYNPLSISVIMHYIVRSIAAGFYICDRNITAVRNMTGFDDYSAKCLLEIEKMKKNKLDGSNITYIEVLHKSVQYLAPYMKSVDLENTIEREFKFPEYPIYQYQIIFKLKRVMKRVNCIKDSQEVIYNSFYKLQLPDTFIRQLYYYLSNNDLEKIVQVSTRKKK